MERHAVRRRVHRALPVGEDGGLGGGALRL
ncbi:MAG: hypothetical protein AVDCRST_MAG04-2492, partial [uncultured Acetobacteraceae bacterium]